MVRKQAKSLLVYGMLALVLVIASVFVANAVISYSQGDSSLTISYNLVTEAKADRVYTPQCFTDCHLPFCFTPSSNSANLIPVTKNDVTQTLDFAQGSDQSILKETGVDYLTTETYTVDVPVYGTCEEEGVNNKTGEKEIFSHDCLLETNQEQRTRQVWKPLKDISQLNLESGKEQCFDIWGKLKPALNGKLYVDVIPHLKLQNKEFVMAEFAPWNASVSYKRTASFNTTSAVNIKFPYRIGSSNGFNGQVIWTLPEESFNASGNYSEWLYYNNLNDYYVVNASEDIERPHSSENSTNPDFNRTSVWKSSYHNLTMHFDQNVTDATGTFSPANVSSSPISYSASGKFGYAVDSQGGGFGIGVGDIDETIPYSIEFWIYPYGTPGGTWRHVWNNWARAVSIRIVSSTNTLVIDSNDAGGSCTNGDEFLANVSLTNNAWHHVVVTTGAGDNAQLQMYQDGALVVNATHCSGEHADIASIGAGSAGYDNGMIDEFRLLNKTLSFDEVKARYWEGIYNLSELGDQQAANSNASATEGQGDDAIRDAIDTSLANASVKYLDQQIYTRNSTGQVLGKFDYVAVLGSKRWAFNYFSSDENTSGLTNMTNMAPVLYVWENQSLTFNEIKEQVKTLINNTYQ